MSLVIEIFRSDDYVPDGEIPLLPVLGAVFSDVIGPSTKGVTFDLYFYQLMDLTPDLGKPSLVNLRASHGFVRVRIWRNGELLYRHPHPVRELIGEPLRTALHARDPDIGHWGYGVRGPGLESIPLRRPAPRVTHELRVGAGARRRPRFTVEEVPEPELPEISLAELGADVEPERTGPLRIMRRRREPDAEAAEATVEAVAEAAEAADEPGSLEASAGGGVEGGAGQEGTSDTVATGQEVIEAHVLAPLVSRPAEQDEKVPPVVVAAPAALVSALVGTFPFSDEIEEGGFLAGRVYRDRERENGYVVHVTAVIPAERTGASMLNFTFTGESFLRVGEQLAARGAGETLLGWYHTHLFMATSRSGLSSVDVELHRSTFRRPWQVAALVNISEDGRVLRFYHGGGTDEQMTKVPYWTVPS
jgi:proteasome lid subunit RPN8/RPN11